MGLRLLRNANGDFPPVKDMKCSTVVAYEGQLVHQLSSGLADPMVSTDLSTAAGCKILGVCAAYKAAAATHIKIYRDRGQNVYAVQADDNSVTGLSHIGENFAVLNAGLGSTVTGQSQAELDASTGGSGTSAGGVHLVLRMQDRLPLVGDAYGTNVKLVVAINPLKLADLIGAGI